MSSEEEEQAFFRKWQTSLTPIERDVRDEEREKRHAFVERTRGVILGLMGYPHGLPNIRGLEINRAYYVEGMDSETYVRTWTKPQRGDRLLHVAYAHVEFGWNSLTLDHRDIAVQAFAGYTYEYAHKTATIASAKGGVRSVDTRRKAKLPLGKGDLWHRGKDGGEEVIDISKYPESSITSLKRFGALPLLDEAARRIDAERHLLPMLQGIRPSSLRDISED